MVDTELGNHLEATTEVNNLVADRIYPVLAPENCKTPYITYMIVNDRDQTSVQGENYGNKTRIQIDIFSDSYAEVKDVLVAVKDALYDFLYQPHGFNSRDLYEKETKLHRQLIDFTLNT